MAIWLCHIYIYYYILDRVWPPDLGRLCGTIIMWYYYRKLFVGTGFVTTAVCRRRKVGNGGNWEKKLEIKTARNIVGAATASAKWYLHNIIQTTVLYRYQVYSSKLRSVLYPNLTWPDSGVPVKHFQRGDY